jgi:small-conductance mechanosensitive channel
VTQAVTQSYLAALALLTLVIVVRDLFDLTLATGPLQRLRSVRDSAPAIGRAARTVTGIAAVLLWTWATLEAFGIADLVFGLGRALLAASVEIGELSISTENVLVLVLSVWLAVYVSRITRFFLDQDVLPRMSLPRGVPGAVSTGTHYLIIAAAVIFGTAAAGLDFSKFAIVIGALSVGIGFGLQNVVNNFISGLILLFERPIQVGDQVQVGTLMGSVKRIGIRASIVRMYEGSEVIVPNGDLISQQVINYTLSDRMRRLELYVGVAYGSDLDHAKATIEEAVNSVENVARDPAPMVLFHGFGESSLDFRVLFWIPDFDVGLIAGSGVGMAINRALRREGIEIPFPQRDLHLKSVSPNASSAVAGGTGRAGGDAD